MKVLTAPGANSGGSSPPSYNNYSKCNYTKLIKQPTWVSCFTCINHFFYVVVHHSWCENIREIKSLRPGISSVIKSKRTTEETQSVCASLLFSVSIISCWLILKEQRPMVKLHHSAGQPVVKLHYSDTHSLTDNRGYTAGLWLIQPKNTSTLTYVEYRPCLFDVLVLIAFIGWIRITLIKI